MASCPSALSSTFPRLHSLPFCDVQFFDRFFLLPVFYSRLSALFSSRWYCLYFCRLLMILMKFYARYQRLFNNEPSHTPHIRSRVYGCNNSSTFRYIAVSILSLWSRQICFVFRWKESTLEAIYAYLCKGVELSISFCLSAWFHSSKSSFLNVLWLPKFNLCSSLLLIKD